VFVVSGSERCRSERGRALPIMESGNRCQPEPRSGCQLLRTEWTATLAGFHHVETMHRLFKRSTGLRPAEFRDQLLTGDRPAELESSKS
jgi:methylphosphotriester-DNA--protein-cysteine methyltransferase